MFIITAKVTKRRLIAAALAVVVLVAGLVLLLTGGKDGEAEESASLTAVVKSEEDRVAYLRSFGWQVGGQVEEQAVTIPREFDQVYADYNAIQLAQGFDLARYGGLEATRYTYEITNHPRAKEAVVADILVYRNQVIAGDVQCVAKDGFMEGLRFPEN